MSTFIFSDGSRKEIDASTDDGDEWPYEFTVSDGILSIRFHRVAIAIGYDEEWAYFPCNLSDEQQLKVLIKGPPK